MSDGPRGAFGSPCFKPSPESAAGLIPQPFDFIDIIDGHAGLVQERLTAGLAAGLSGLDCEMHGHNDARCEGEGEKSEGEQAPSQENSVHCTLARSGS
jgi:hypothetical protein